MTEDLDYDTIGGRLSAAREAAGKSVSQVARHLGVKSKTLADWENDRSEPRANRLVMLSGLLNVTPTWLLTGHGSGPSAGVSTEDIMMAQAEMGRALKALQDAQEAVAKASDRLARVSSAVSDIQGSLDEV